MRVRPLTARVLGWISLVCTTAALVTNPAWMWRFYTLWNLVIVYVASAISLQWPSGAPWWTATAILSSWTTAILYTLVLVFFPQRTKDDPVLFWVANSALHYVPAFLASAAFNPPPRSSAPLAGLLCVLLFYSLTHDTEKIYDTNGISNAAAMFSALATAALSFYIFLPGEYLSAHKLFW